MTVEVKTIEQFMKLYTEILTLNHADEIITSDHYEIHKSDELYGNFPCILQLLFDFSKSIIENI